MKIVYLPILVLALSLSQTFAQRPSERRTQEKIAEIGNDVDFNKGSNIYSDVIPEKWLNESAVILYTNASYSFLRRNQFSVMKEVVRKRIVLNDKAAVKEFSEFYYRKSTAAGFQIIKTDGSTRSIDAKEAILVDTTVPNFFRTSYKYSDGYFKLAIPGLEVGDIIDYFYASEDEFLDESGTVTAFQPFIQSLQSDYPTVKLDIDFTVDRGFYLSFNAFNNAPSLIEGGPGFDINGRQRKSIQTYSLTASNLDKYEDSIWDYQFVNSPTIKYQVYYSRKKIYQGTEYFVGNIGEVKNTVKPEEIANRFLEKSGTFYPHIGITAQLVSYLQKNFRGESDPDIIAEAAYYYYRFLVNSMVVKNNDDDLDASYTVGKYIFAYNMLKVLQSNGVEAKLLATTPRQYGSIEDILLGDELILGVEYIGKKGPQYLFPFSNHTSLGNYFFNIDGADAYVFDVDMKKLNLLGYQNTTLPQTRPQDNLYLTKTNITILDDFEKLDVEQLNILAGRFKNNYSGLALGGYRYLDVDREFYDFEDKKSKRGNKAIFNEKLRKEAAIDNKRKEKQVEMLKSRIEDHFAVEEYIAIELLEDGRMSENLVFKENFVIKDLVYKAGQNLIFDVGQLIGKQIELSDKHIVRSYDAQLGYSRTIEEEIVVNVPNGYKVKGLHDLQFDIDNSTSSFKSQVSEVDNQLIIKTSKTYKRNVVPVSLWMQQVESLEAAYTFTQKKVILEKI